MTGRYHSPRPAFLANYGCTKELWLELRDLGLQMVARGASSETTPLRAYTHQRDTAARRRGIAFKLTLTEWWDIWTASGHWSERGAGRGYMMCRKGDVGAYEVGNVFIDTGPENVASAMKKTGLPIGVCRVSKPNKKRPYRALCTVGGKQRHLGTFATVDEARAAYLAALEFDTALKAAPVRRAA